MRSLIALVFVILLCVACASDRDMVKEYAECLANPYHPLHEASGSLSAYQMEFKLRTDLGNEEVTEKDIETAFKLYCE